jgi:hypothetical protein
METRNIPALLSTRTMLLLMTLMAGTTKAQYEGPTVTADYDGDGPYRVLTTTMYEIGSATGYGDGT